jgi:hypothetical protein
MVALILILVSLLFGLFLLLKPSSAIELQRRFYEKINWKIEPVSMTKEVRNTKIMGASVAIFSIAISLLYFLLR